MTSRCWFCLLAALLLAAPPAQAQQAVKIRLATLAPKGSTYHRALQEMSVFLGVPIWDLAQEAWGWPDPCAGGPEMPPLPPEFRDVELMIRQLSGRYQVKSHSLKPLYDPDMKRIKS